MIGRLSLMVAICNRTSLAVDYAVLCALSLISIFGWEKFRNKRPVRMLLPKVLSDQIAARLFGDGISMSVSLVLLLPIELLFVPERLPLRYKYLADALISFLLIAFLMIRQGGKPASLLDRPFLAGSERLVQLLSLGNVRLYCHRCGCSHDRSGILVREQSLQLP
jgi:hypothetical protein